MGRFLDAAIAIGTLTDEKNEAYGDSFQRSGDVLEILYPEGVMPSQYRDALGVVRVVDKLFRIATRKDAFGESPWRDIAGYSLLGAVADAPLPSEFRDTSIPSGDEVGDAAPATLRSYRSTEPMDPHFPDRFLRPEDIRPLVSEARYVIIHRCERGKILGAQHADDIVEAVDKYKVLKGLAFPKETVEIRNAADAIVQIETIRSEA